MASFFTLELTCGKACIEESKLKKYFSKTFTHLLFDILSTKTWKVQDNLFFFCLCKIYMICICCIMYCLSEYGAWTCLSMLDDTGLLRFCFSHKCCFNHTAGENTKMLLLNVPICLSSQECLQYCHSGDPRLFPSKPHTPDLPMILIQQP